MFLKREYLKAIKQLNLEKKFEQVGNTSISVKNDLIYSYTLEKKSRGYEIEFGVRSMFEETYNVSCGEFCLSECGNNFEYYLEVADIIRDIKQIVFPFFDACKDSQSAIYGIENMYVIMDERRIEMINQRGGQDMADPLALRMCFDYTLHCLAKKAGDEERVKKYLGNQIAAHSKVIPLVGSVEEKEAIARTINDLAAEIHRIEENGLNQFAAELAKNKERNEIQLRGVIRDSQ